MAAVSAVELLDEAIADLEAKLNIQPGEILPAGAGGGEPAAAAGAAKAPPPPKQKKAKQANNNNNNNRQKAANTGPNLDQPDICKLEFKVGVITKVWVHPSADKLYCEEIDVGEEQPRQIASGLRPHFTEEQMLGQRLLVASNLKAKNLVGFKSHGMVLCAAKPGESPDTEEVQFVEPPKGAPIGEVITYEGLPKPEPFSPAQVEKKKAWQAAAKGMKTTNDCLAAWNGHVFMTTAGPCRTKSVASGPMR